VVPGSLGQGRDGCLQLVLAEIVNVLGKSSVLSQGTQKRQRNMSEFKFTRYFEEKVLQKRSSLRKEWCIKGAEEPLKLEAQEDNRYRFWNAVPELGGRVLCFMKTPVHAMAPRMVLVRNHYSLISAGTEDGGRQVRERRQTWCLCTGQNPSGKAK
jgi:hypothetical protein